MIDEAEVILQGMDRRSPVALRQATFVGVTNGSAIVDMGTSRFVCDFGAGYIPVSGETVQILSIGQRHTLYPVGPRPGAGTVMTVSSTMVTVQTVAGDIAMPFVGTAPTSGDVVALGWSEGPRCLGKLSSTPVVAPPPPDPGGNIIRSATFLAIDAGSTDRGAPRWWTGQPRAGNTTYGAWFYGSQIKDTIPASASFVSVEFYVSWQQRKGAAPRFALHTAGTKGGVPGFAPYVEWTPAGAWQIPPGAESWFNALKAGGAYAGVGLNQGGDNIFSSLAQDSWSGALRISWRS
jgi:hypothetical protein